MCGNSMFEGKYKLDTFHNTIRGELNHHEINNPKKSSQHLYCRGEKGLYSLSDKGEQYAGR